MSMLASRPSEGSLIEREKRNPSEFRPPRFVKSVPPQHNVMKASARPWLSPYNGRATRAEEDWTSFKGTTALHPAAGPWTSPDAKASITPPPPLDRVVSSPSSTSSPFSPMLTPINTFFHTISEEAAKKRVYPIGMFLSARKDASHTPHGVLKWCVRQYLEVPSLKVPGHLQLSMNDVVNAEDGVTRGALGSGLKSKTRNKIVRQTHHKVMSVLSRITPAKYKELVEELFQLPLRQSDDAELQEIVKVFFDKSVEEHTFSDMYARLVKELCTMRESELELDPEVRERLFSNRIRKQLMTACEEQFRRPIELSADEKVDRTTGKPFDEEEISMKRTRMKDRLVGNVKFVGELYKLDLVTERVVEDILQLLVGGYDPNEPTAKEEYVFEVLAMLIKTVAPILKERRPFVLSHFLGVAKTVERSHPKLRVRFLMMNLADLNEKSHWIATEHVLRSAQSCENAASTNSLSSLAADSPTRVQPPPAADGTAQRGSPPPHNGAKSVDAPRAVSSANQTAPPLNSQSAQVPRPHQRPQQLNPSALQGSQSQYQSSIPPSTNVSVSDCGPRQGKSGSSSLYAASGAANASPSNSLNVPPLPTAGGKNDGLGGNARLFSPKDGAYSGRARQHSLPNFMPPSQTSMSSLTPADRPSPFTPAISMSELSSAHTSDGASTPVSTRMSRAALLGRCLGSSLSADAVSIQDVAFQLMELYNDPEQSRNVLHCIQEMNLKNKVLCLTWWLRLLAMSTALFEERQRLAYFLSDLLSSCPSIKAEELYVAVVEWIRFDIERGRYDQCPRMFDNIAHMVLYCHSAEVSALPHIAEVRQLFNTGLFNIMLHGLTTDRGTDQMVTLVKSAHPVSLAVMGSFTDPAEPAAVLRLAAESRFRLLPYFLSVSTGTESDLPGTPASGYRTPTTPSLRSPLGDSITTTVHYDPLSRCLVFQRVADDPEIQLYRKIWAECGERGSNSNTWRDEAVKLALTPVGNGSVVSQLLQFMKVVGAMLACTSVSQHSNNLLTFADVGAVMKEILTRRPGTLFEAAAVIELILHFTQALSGGSSAGIPRKSTRIKPLRQALARWCSQEIVHKAPVMELIASVEADAPCPRIFTTYHNAVADADLPWHSTLKCLS